MALRLKQVRMTASAFKHGIVTLQFVDEQLVRAKVTFPVVIPIAGKPMVFVFGGQRPAAQNFFHYPFQQCHV